MVETLLRIRFGTEALDRNYNVSGYSIKSVPPPTKSSEDFTGTLKGEKVTLEGVKTQEIKYVKRSSDELLDLRTEFKSSARKTFLENLSKDTDYLKKAGFSDTDILKIQNGRVPDGWQAHHKLPLDDSGTNDLDNLILINNEPYHKVITNYQNSIASQMEVGEITSIEWPMPEGNIYPLKP